MVLLLLGSILLLERGLSWLLRGAFGFTSQLLAVSGTGWGLWKTSVHERHAAAGKIEYWFTESEHSRSKSSQHEQINGSWEQSPAINSYKKKSSLVPLRPSLSLSHHLFPSQTSSWSALPPAEIGAMPQGSSEMIQNTAEHNILCHLRFFVFTGWGDSSFGDVLVEHSRSPDSTQPALHC